jgi:hypothetical protein
MTTVWPGGEAGFSLPLPSGAKSIGALHPVTPLQTRPALTFDELLKEINACLPVRVRVQWDDGTGHFAVLWACARYSSGDEVVKVADPFFGYGTVEFGEFSLNYLDCGEWTHTYPVGV